MEANEVSTQMSAKRLEAKIQEKKMYMENDKIDKFEKRARQNMKEKGFHC